MNNFSFVQSLKRIAKSGENDIRRFLLAECLEAYINLDEQQRQQFQALLDTQQFREAKPLMITTYERGKAEGKIEGRAEGIQEGKLEGKLETCRENVLLILSTRFAPLSPAIQHKVAEITLDQLRQLLVDLI